MNNFNKTYFFVINYTDIQFNHLSLWSNHSKGPSKKWTWISYEYLYGVCIENLAFGIILRVIMHTQKQRVVNWSGTMPKGPDLAIHSYDFFFNENEFNIPLLVAILLITYLWQVFLNYIS